MFDEKCDTVFVDHSDLTAQPAQISPTKISGPAGTLPNEYNSVATRPSCV